MRIFASLYQYNTYLSKRFNSFPPKSDRSFVEYQQWISNDYSNLFQSLFYELCRRDEVEFGEWTIGNSPHLQHAWEKRDRASWQADTSQAEILLRQLKHYKPDVFLAFHFPVNGSFLKVLKTEVPSIRLIIGWDGRKLHNVKRFENIDLMLSCLPSSVDFYRSHGFEAAYLPFHFDQRVLKSIDPRPRLPRVVFPGGIHLAHDGHNERLRLLNCLRKLPELETYLEFNGLTNWRVWAGLLKRGDWDHFGNLFQLSLQNNRPVYGLEMFQLLASSMVAANIHIDAADNMAGNIRLFEATGVGTCLLTDFKSNLGELFELDSEVISYTSFNECVEKCRWLLDHPNTALEIGAKAARRVEKDHSTKQRAVELEATIQDALQNRK